MIRSHHDLIAWQRAMDLVAAVYEVAARLPAHELYGIGAQLRRAAVSIAANIAEGHGREDLGDYLRHLSFALGSAAEVETLLLLIERLYRLDRAVLTPAAELTASTGQLLNALIRSLRRRRNASPATRPGPGVPP